MRKLLIDECLSQALVAVAKERGHFADHVVWVGKSGMQDWSLIPFAVEHDYTFVTNNRRDFLEAYARIPLHDGVVTIVPTLPRADQVRLFGLALDYIATVDDTVNRLIEVFADGRIITVDWHAPEGADPPGA